MKLHVKNFGPIREAKVEIRPMMVFVGHSNTGKSYLAMLVYAIAKVFALADNRESFSVSFSNMFPNPPRLMTIDPDGNTLEGEIDAGKFLDERYARAVIYGVLRAYSDRVKRVWEIKGAFYFGKELILDKQAGFSLLITDETNKIVFDLSPSGDKFKISDAFVKKIIKKLETKLREILAERRTVALKRKSKKESLPQPLISDTILVGMYDNDSPINIFNIILDSIDFSLSHIDGYPDEKTKDKIHYLPAGRGVVMESHLSIANAIIHNAAAAHSDESSFNGVTADFFQKLLSIKDSLNISDERKKIAIFSDKMEKRIAKGRIKLKISATGYPHFSYTLENVKKDDIPLTKASSAVSELASVILFIRYYLSRGDLFIVEEPEANLHTVAQREIAALLVELVNAGVQVLITTHSDVILEQISNCMLASRLPKGSKVKVLRNAKLAPEKINAYTFVESKRGTKVQLVPPDAEDSDILSEDHTDVSSDLYNESVRIYNTIQENGD